MDLQTAIQQKKELEDILYHKPIKGVRKVKESISLLDRICFFESIKTLTKYIKEHGKDGI